jgi:N-acyl homoserine lactone hydrolase
MVPVKHLRQARHPIAKTVLALLAILGGAGTATAVPPDVELWRLDCGRFDDFDMSALSDDDRYKGQKRNLANGCYLIRHGSDYVLWDAGLPTGSKGQATVGPQRSIATQVAQIGVSPEQIRYLGISHWHPDHIGQAAEFSKAKLLIGAADWDQLKNPPKWLDASPLAPWMSGGSALELVSRDAVLSHDKDLFGDGSVVMIKTPGHTPGHHALLVHLPKKGAVMLSGDLYHQHESYDHDVVPSENQDRADTLASIDRFKRLVSRYRATVIVQHDVGDIDKLPAFPSSAR